jgi:hypothetical protein
MNKKIVIAIATAIVILAGGITAYALSNNSSPTGAPVSSAPATQKNTVATNTGSAVTKTGTIECLTPKDTSGPQTTSCAIGMKQDDGTSYALNADDPTTTGSIPTGSRVQVTGTLSQQTTQYTIAGIIHVISIQRL